MAIINAEACIYQNVPETEASAYIKLSDPELTNHLAYWASVNITEISAADVASARNLLQQMVDSLKQL
jgi:hypothetical protein